MLCQARVRTIVGRDGITLKPGASKRLSFQLSVSSLEILRSSAFLGNPFLSNRFGTVPESPRNHPRITRDSLHNGRHVLPKRSQQPQQAKWKAAFKGERSMRVGAPARGFAATGRLRCWPRVTGVNVTPLQHFVRYSNDAYGRKCAIRED